MNDREQFWTVEDFSGRNSRTLASFRTKEDAEAWRARYKADVAGCVRVTPEWFSKPEDYIWSNKFLQQPYEARVAADGPDFDPKGLKSYRYPVTYGEGEEWEQKGFAWVFLRKSERRPEGAT